MTFDDILGDGRLWAVRYEGDEDNILYVTFNRWYDIEWLGKFFSDNKDDLSSYFRITNLNQAIFDTLSDASELECLILDSYPGTDLDLLFKPLENHRASEMLLSKEKAKGDGVRNHASWLRLYAIRFETNSYLITGGAIKLTRTMQEREHTLKELQRLEMVRNMLVSEGVTDLDGFSDFINSDKDENN